MLSARKVILLEIIYNHPIMKLHFPWALDLRIWQGCFTDMIIPALFYCRFAFVTKLLLPRFRKLLTRWKKFCSHIRARAIYMYTIGLLKPCHRRLTYSARVSQYLIKSRQEMQENGKRIRSYQLDGPKFSMLFCSRENRQENVLDSTDQF